MTTKIFVNLPVKDLDRSKAFFVALGWTINPQFTDETAACVVISEDIFVMLLTHEKFAQFTDRRIAEPGSVEAITCIGVDAKADVDRIAEAALAAGGREAKPPQDYGFMVLRS